MKTLSIINLKGGVAKTISTATMAYILAAERGYRVLMIDNDKQGNLSKMYDLHSYDHKGTDSLMTERSPIMAALIRHTDYAGLDIITSNMTLINANLTVQTDQRRPQHDRFKKALSRIADQYDFCLIDNAPDINISTVNALVASDYVMIPVTIDDFALDGLSELAEQIENTREDMNPELDFLGCFVTQYVGGDAADRQGAELLLRKGYPVFYTRIRRTDKVKPATFQRQPVPVYSTRCAAALDYRKLVTEFLKGLQMKNSKFNLTEIMNNRSVRRERDQVEGQITIQDWLEWKEDIRNRLQETSENFIVIGYRLKQMRESRMYEQEGFRSLSEFAQREYNLSRSVVSRLIQINDRFSEDGNSMELKAEYRNYGFAKLQEMLYLTDEELEEVTEDMTVREVREIRMEREQPEEEEPEEPKEGAGSVKEEKEVATPQQNDDDWKEKKPEPKPIEPPPRDAVYREKIGRTMLSEITGGSRRYLILKMRHKYRAGNTLILMECFKGRRTGKIVTVKITHMTDDSGGLIPGYCVIGFSSFTEAQEEVREDDED